MCGPITAQTPAGAAHIVSGRVENNSGARCEFGVASGCMQSCAQRWKLHDP